MKRGMIVFVPIKYVWSCCAEIKDHPQECEEQCLHDSVCYDEGNDARGTYVKDRKLGNPKSTQNMERNLRPPSDTRCFSVRMERAPGRHDGR